jgi:hypothetical protein
MIYLELFLIYLYFLQWYDPEFKIASATFAHVFVTVLCRFNSRLDDSRLMAISYQTEHRSTIVLRHFLAL